MVDDTALYIGLMSGTSLDGVDGVLVSFDGAARPVVVHGHAHRPFDAALQAELLALNHSGSDELHRAALATNRLVMIQAALVADLLGEAGRSAEKVRAIGSHGQTVRHRPGEFDGRGYTLQLNSGALLAELTGIDVICDFRSRDVAAGGQGAPLVPAFHAMVFGDGPLPRAVLNLGGIANLTLLAGPDQPVRGFDCGPGNALLDHWIQRCRGLPYDSGGAWSAGGSVDAALLDALSSEPFLAKPPPKSTGRDLFNASWLDQMLNRLAPRPSDQDVMASLTEFSARCAAGALQRFAPGTTELLCCGGGALNADLMRRLAARLTGVQVGTTDGAGLPAMQVEASAFAWLARAFVNRSPGNRPEVTGARGLRLLGACYPAR